MYLKEFIFNYFWLQTCILSQERTYHQMFTIVLSQLQNRYFLENLPVVDFASVAFDKRRSSDVIQLISLNYSCEFPLKFICILISQLYKTNKKTYLFYVSMAKPLSVYSGNIKMQNFKKFRIDIVLTFIIIQYVLNKNPCRAETFSLISTILPNKNWA